ncbi:MAG: ATP synthase F0 subunit C [Proteobacteria bacterium]|nr:ATP synthase F0 subunit C [Pseudomonadota bacterium]MCK5244130.1 ATP synthase F0 subunit C [Desulfobacterales bacterium]
MKKYSVSTVAALVLVLGFSSLAFASEGAIGALEFYVWSVIAAGLCIAFAAGLCGIGQGMGLKSAVEGIARNPEASGKVTVTLLIGLAMIESLCIYALVISLIILYANPAAKLLG